jgi:iron(III) transport system permease protein
MVASMAAGNETYFYISLWWTLGLGLLMASWGSWRASRGDFARSRLAGTSAGLLLGFLLLFLAYPLLRAALTLGQDEFGKLVPGLAWDRLSDSRIWSLNCLVSLQACGTAWNSLLLGLISGFTTSLLGTVLAFTSERVLPAFRKPLGLFAILPMLMPPFVVGLGLVMLFGRAGVINNWLEESFAWSMGRWLYGLEGLVLAQIFSFTPIAYLMMRGVVQNLNPALDEAAQSLGASRMRILRTVTLPMLLPGFSNACIVGFIESIADFGNPLILAGSYNVLATDIFFSVVGAQLDFGRACAQALVLAAFAMTAIAIQSFFLSESRHVSISGKSDASQAMRLPAPVSFSLASLSVLWIMLLIAVYSFAFAGGFVTTWGRDYSPSLEHLMRGFAIEQDQSNWLLSGPAWDSLLTTLKLALIAAPVSALIALLMAYWMSRLQFVGRSLMNSLSVLAFAIPGTVIGVSYILAFNVPPFELTGTGLLIVICLVVRVLPVSIRSQSAVIQQIDRSLDEASMTLGASLLQTLAKVIWPLIRPAMVAALLYGFVRAMTTESAVIFLVNAEYELATTWIIGRIGQGDYGLALAYCSVLTLIMTAVAFAVQALLGDRRQIRRQEMAANR